jgi:hypothetical protein
VILSNFRVSRAVWTGARPKARYFGTLLLHRECHPGDVLWSRGKVSGVVDWVRIGSPCANVGHCRVNLAYQFGQEAAERFLAIYQALTGRRSTIPTGTSWRPSVGWTAP